MTAILAPLDAEPVVELARSPRIFRKQVLRTGEIDYKGRRIAFTPDYLDGLVAAYQERAFDAVPLVFADKDNTHTQAVDRIRGQVIGLERNGDRLDAIVQAANDDAAALLRDNPYIGVSARIEQPIERADGQHWPAAIQHVLATANPRITGMGPWQPVDLAAEPGAVLDLSHLDFADTDEDATPETQEDDVPDQAVFTPEEIARLRALLATDDTAEKADKADEPEVDGYEMPSDDELAAIAAAALDDDREPVAAGAELSAEAAAALELAHSRADRMEIELATLRAERDAARYERERDQLAETYGIPPRITELARPLLLGAHVVELANGGSVDAGEVMRTVLKAVGEHVKLVDLSGPAVFEASRDDDARAQERSREDEAAAYISQFGLR